MLGCCFVAIGIVEILSRLFFLAFQADPMAILAIARSLEIASVLFIAFRETGGLACIGIIPARVIQGVGRGMIWSAGFAGIVAIGFLLIYAAGGNPLHLFHVRLPESGFRLMLYFIVGGGLGPVAEEMFFRGLLYSYFRSWGLAAALGISTAFFVMAHPQGSGIPLPQLIGGLVFGISFEIEKNLMVPITIHILGNHALFCLELIA